MNDYIEMRVDELTPYENNARTHNESQIEKIARSIAEFGFINPVLIDQHNMIIAGHGRVLGAKKLGLETVPCLRIEYLTDEQKRAYILADNRLAEDAGWDMDLVEEELRALADYDFDISLTGFELPEITFDDDEDSVPEENDLSNDVKNTFEVIVECDSEMKQEEVFNRLSGEGYTCRVLTL